MERAVTIASHPGSQKRAQQKIGMLTSRWAPQIAREIILREQRQSGCGCLRADLVHGSEG